MDDAAVERELEAELQKDYLFASALHGHKMSLVKQERGSSPPPAPIQHRKIRRSDLNIGKMIIKNLFFYFLFYKWKLANLKLLKPYFYQISGDGDQDGDLSSHSKSLKSLERQIFMETLRYEQERLQLVKNK